MLIKISPKIRRKKFYDYLYNIRIMNIISNIIKVSPNNKSFLVLCKLFNNNYYYDNIVNFKINNNIINIFYNLNFSSKSDRYIKIKITLCKFNITYENIIYLDKVRINKNICKYNDKYFAELVLLKNKLIKKKIQTQIKYKEIDYIKNTLYFESNYKNILKFYKNYSLYKIIHFYNSFNIYYYFINYKILQYKIYKNINFFIIINYINNYKIFYLFFDISFISKNNI